MATGNGSAIAVECGWYLYSDGHSKSLDPLNPSGVAQHKVLFSDTYQGADWWRYKISAADVLAGGSVIYVHVTSRAMGGSETMIVDENGKRVDTIRYYSSGPESDATVGPEPEGPSYPPVWGSVICTELHRQGLLDEAIFKADQAFGMHLRDGDGAVLVGYHLWAKPVVSLMQKSSAFTQIVNVLARLWYYKWRIEWERERKDLSLASC